MTVQEIFNTKAVQEIETEILNLQYETDMIILSWTKIISCC